MTPRKRIAWKLIGWTMYATAALALNSAFIRAQKQIFSPEGGTDLLAATFLLEAPLGIMTILLLFSLARLLFKSQRQRAVRLLLISFVYVLAGYGCMIVSAKIRLKGFRDLAARGRPIVDAIRKFEELNGYPPHHLEELAPDYLPGIPKTELGVSPQYRYETDMDKSGHLVEDIYHGNGWVLHVTVPDFVTEWRGLLYYPKQNYSGYDNERPRRMGFMEIDGWFVVSGLPQTPGRRD